MQGCRNVKRARGGQLFQGALSILYAQARSQDLEKGGGYFERVRKVQTTLTRILIVLESVSHGLSKNSDEISRKFEGFFRPKSGGLQKKKKKVFAEIESDFSAEIRNSKVFSAQNQVVSKKKKKKVFAEIESDFLAEIQRFFPPKIRCSPKKKKKKKVFAEIESDFSAEIRNSNVSGGAIFLWGGYFQFFTKNRPQKH